MWMRPPRAGWVTSITSPRSRCFPAPRRIPPDLFGRVAPSPASGGLSTSARRRGRARPGSAWAEYTATAAAPRAERYWPSFPARGVERTSRSMDANDSGAGYGLNPVEGPCAVRHRNGSGQGHVLEENARLGRPSFRKEPRGGFKSMPGGPVLAPGRSGGKRILHKRQIRCLPPPDRGL